MYDGHLQYTESPKPFLGIIEKVREEEESEIEEAAKIDESD